MSANPTFSTSDLRSNAQMYKRDATHKHKWALGAVEVQGRAPGKPRPARPSGYKIPSHYHRKVSVRDDDDDSSGSSSDAYDDNHHGVPSPAVDAGVMYSFDRPTGPSEGSQILNLALSKAVERFEERETAKLVHSEYDVLNADGESIAVALDQKRKHKHRQAAPVADVSDADEDYEFV